MIHRLRQFFCKHEDAVVPLEIFIDQYVVGEVCTKCGKVWISEKRIGEYKKWKEQQIKRIIAEEYEMKTKRRASHDP